MRQSTLSLQHFTSSKRLARGDAIEWEELPSLADSLAERLVNDPARRRQANPLDSAPGPVWDNTMPAELQVHTPTQPFRETLNGLAMREVHEPEVFRHFFGSLATS